MGANDQINRCADVNISTPEKSEFIDLFVDITNNHLKGVTRNGQTSLREVLDFSNPNSNKWTRVSIDNADLINGEYLQAYLGRNHPEIVLYDSKNTLQTHNPTIEADIINHVIVVDFGGNIVGTWTMYFREMISL